MPSEPQKEISIDFITNLLSNKYRNCVYNTILVVVNRYIKILRYIPTTKKINTIKLIDLFYTKIILKYSKLYSIITNKGSIFTSTFQSKVYYNLYIKYRLSTAFHP